jgi:hypothetical protein
MVGADIFIAPLFKDDLTIDHGTFTAYFVTRAGDYILFLEDTLALCKTSLHSTLRLQAYC